MRQLFELLLLLPLDGVLFLGYVSQRRTAFFFSREGRGVIIVAIVDCYPFTHLYEKTEQYDDREPCGLKISDCHTSITPKSVKCNVNSKQVLFTPHRHSVSSFRN